jgi:drug/metabolite transporter (DMT)-like permease
VASEIEAASTPKTNITRIALAALIAGAIGIGVAPVFVRLSEAGPMATGFWRLFLAAPIFWLWANAEKRDTAPPTRLSRAHIILLAAAGLFYACDLGTWHLSLHFTTIANATLLTNFAPIFVTLGAWLLWRERFRKMFYVGLVLAILGATMLIGASFGVGDQQLLGDLWGLVSAAFYGAYLLSVKQLRQHLSTPLIMLWSGLVASAALLVFALVLGEQILAVTLAGWLMLIALALISQVGGQGLIAFALRHLPAPFSSVTLLLQPVVATFLAWLLFDEVLGGWQAVGAAIVLTGIWLARRGSR